MTWRALCLTARLLSTVACDLKVTGSVPAELRGRPVILAANHIGVFDPVVVMAACRSQGLAPRFMAAGGLFRVPGLGLVLRSAGLIRVDRRSPTVAHALGAARAALTEGCAVAAYPEGRISLDPGIWPERGKTGLARLALSCGVPVIPVSQWGAHEVMVWHGWAAMLARLARSVVTRPVVRVHFGPAVDLSDLSEVTPSAAKQATDRIMDALVTGLVPLRAHEPRLPRYVDPTRPLTTGRRHRPRR